MNGQLTKLTDYPEVGSVVTPENNIFLRLKRSKEHHERELAKVNEALDALEKQPEVAQLLQAVLKAL
jgi:hypothetical protein